MDVLWAASLARIVTRIFLLEIFRRKNERERFGSVSGGPGRN